MENIEKLWYLFWAIVCVLVAIAMLFIAIYMIVAPKFELFARIYICVPTLLAGGSYAYLARKNFIKWNSVV